MQERLQKLIAQAGITSRRDAEVLIANGRVTVNGVAAHLGDKADIAVDDVRVDGEKLHIDTKRIYIMINKPMGIVTATRAQEQEVRRTVRELVPIEGHLYPVGRLDADSEGLVVLTDDGELAQKLTHPRYQHPKVYEVTLRGLIPEEALNIWRRGIVLEDGMTKPVDVRVLSRDKDSSQIRVTMREGRKRQIRRIAKTLGYPVRRLVRTELDTLLLGDLAVGTWRYLTEGEIRDLQQSASSTRHRLRADPRYNPVFDPRSRKKPAQAEATEYSDEQRPPTRRPVRSSSSPSSSRRPSSHSSVRRSTRGGSSDSRRPRTSGSAVRYTRSRSEASESGESSSRPDSSASEGSDSRSSGDYRQARLTQAGIRPSSRSGSAGRSSSRSGTRSSSRSSSRTSSRSSSRPNSGSNNKPGSKSGGKLRSGRPSKIGGKSGGKSGSRSSSRSSGSSGKLPGKSPSKSRGKPRDKR